MAFDKLYVAYMVLVFLVLMASCHQTLLLYLKGNEYDGKNTFYF